MNHNEFYEAKVRELEAKIERLRSGLDAAIRAANLALFVIRKQGVMPNSSWESGFKSDLAKATAARGPDVRVEGYPTSGDAGPGTPAVAARFFAGAAEQKEPKEGK